MSPELPGREQALTPEETKRWHELSKMHKPELCALYRQLGHTWSKHPLEKWTKEETISGILEVEFREERAKKRAHFEEVSAAATHSGPHAIDVDQPYGYRVERLDEAEDRALTTHYRTEPETEEDRPRCSYDVARRAVTLTRYGHGYYGPLRVFVWAHRGDAEHYRQPVPDIADVFEFGPNPRLKTWLAGHLPQETQAPERCNCIPGEICF